MRSSLRRGRTRTGTARRRACRTWCGCSGRAAGTRGCGGVADGSRVAYDGWVFAVRRTAAQVELRATGEVLSRVTDVSKRLTDAVVDATIRLPNGELSVVSGTPEHPFYVPSHGGYVDLGELKVGVELELVDGDRGVLVGKSWRYGVVQVHNFEVEGVHNYFVDGGTLVHNGITQKCSAGHYIIETFKGCTYVGKGDRRRMRRSVRRLNLENPNDPVLNANWFPSASREDAFRDEAYWMDLLGWKAGGCFYNQSNSPGHGMYDYRK